MKAHKRASVSMYHKVIFQCTVGICHHCHLVVKAAPQVGFVATERLPVHGIDKSIAPIFSTDCVGLINQNVDYENVMCINRFSIEKVTV